MEYEVLSSAMEHYLEKILCLQKATGVVRITDLAKTMNISKASVTQAIHKLQEQGYVNQQSYGPIVLTNKGSLLAAKIQIRHTKLKRFLIEVLRVDPTIAEEDASKIEHALSQHTMSKLTAYLCSGECLEHGCTMQCSESA